MPCARAPASPAGGSRGRGAGAGRDAGRAAGVKDAVPAAAAEAFLRQLVWREFSHHLLAHFPDTPLHNLDARFDAFPWRRDARALRAWKQGRTGFRSWTRACASSGRRGPCTTACA